MNVAQRSHVWRMPMAFVAWSAFLFVVGISTLGTIGAALVLGTALWVGTMVVGRLNVRLAWLFFVIFCAVQPLLLGVSQASWWLSVSNSNSFPRLDTLREAIHLLSLAVCGPLVWIVVRMRLIEFNPLLHILLLPSAALFQGCVLWFIGDRFLRKHDTAATPLSGADIGSAPLVWFHIRSRIIISCSCQPGVGRRVLALQGSAQRLPARCPGSWPCTGQSCPVELPLRPGDAAGPGWALRRAVVRGIMEAAAAAVLLGEGNAFGIALVFGVGTG